MATEKLVDGDFLAKLLDSSYENIVGAVDEAVMNNVELFGGDTDTVRTIGTYSDHVLIANQSGEFFRCKWAVEDKDGTVVLSDVQEIDVPVYEASEMGTQVRDESLSAVREIMSGEVPEERLRFLYNMSKSGVRFTAEGVEDLYNKQSWFEHDWFKAIEEKRSSILEFLGGEAHRLGYSKPLFGSLVRDEIDEDQAETHRDNIVSALKKMRTVFANMRSQTALARQVTEGYRLRDKDDDGEASTDFVKFVEEFTKDLDGVLGLINDAVAVSKDGCVKCLARVHDGIADQAYEWSLAAAFSEKLARKFEPVAA